MRTHTFLGSTGAVKLIEYWEPPAKGSPSQCIRVWWICLGSFCLQCVLLSHLLNRCECHAECLTSVPQLCVQQLLNYPFYQPLLCQISWNGANYKPAPWVPPWFQCWGCSCFWRAVSILRQTWLATYWPLGTHVSAIFLAEMYVWVCYAPIQLVIVLVARLAKCIVGYKVC